MRELHQIIVEPHITESTSKMLLDSKTGVHKYVFKVSMTANKIEIRQAVESRFGVKVDSVRTAIFRGKSKRVRVAQGLKANWKKAIVRLQPGHKIAEFEGT